MSEAATRDPWIRWSVIAVGVALLAGGLVAALSGRISPPAYFMATASVMLVLALAAMYQSFRGVFGHRGVAMGVRATLPERAALIDEKNALLRAIKDIAFEHEVGKLSDADFQRLDRAYRVRAKEVLRKLDDDIAPYLERAEELIARELEPADAAPKRKPKKDAAEAPRRECVKCSTRNKPDAEWCKECGARIAPIECASCGAENEPDAKFCIKCASALARGASQGSDEA